MTSLQPSRVCRTTTGIHACENPIGVPFGASCTNVPAGMALPANIKSLPYVGLESRPASVSERTAAIEIHPTTRTSSFE